MTSTTATETNSVEQPKTPAAEPENKTDAPEKAEDGKPDANDTGAPESPTKKPAEPKPTVHKTDFEEDLVYLYQFARCPTIPSLSPFCLKVETWLRMVGLKYENVDHKMKYKSKKGQLPFIEINGAEIADSDIIIRDLSTKFEKNLDEGLTDDQRNISHAFESMLNNHTSWVVRWWRYNNPDEFVKTAELDIKRTLNSKLPKGILNLLFKWGFKSNVKQAIGHGIGHHTNEEIYDFGKSDLKALSDVLLDKDYFFGKEPHLLDCVAFAHLTQFVYVPFADMKEWIETNTPNLIAHTERIKNRYWSDWDEITKTLELNTHLPKKELTPEQIEEQKKIEEKKIADEQKKEEKRKEKEEKKKAKEEAAKKAKEEKEARKKAEKEAKEQAAKEKAEKEKLEKEKKEQEAKEAKEKADKEKEEAKAKADAEAAAKATADAEAAKSAPAAEDAKPSESGDAAAPAATTVTVVTKEEVTTKTD